MILWAVAIGFADWAYFLIAPVITDKFGNMLLSVPLSFGMYITYSIFRLRMPGLEDKKQLDAQVMASFAYQSESTQRWFVWLFATIGGVANTLLLLLSNLLVTGKL